MVWITVLVNGICKFHLFSSHTHCNVLHKYFCYVWFTSQGGWRGTCDTSRTKVRLFSVTCSLLSVLLVCLAFHSFPYFHTNWLLVFCYWSKNHFCFSVHCLLLCSGKLSGWYVCAKLKSCNYVEGHLWYLVTLRYVTCCPKDYIQDPTLWLHL